jgi:hypothetical protein
MELGEEVSDLSGLIRRQRAWVEIQTDINAEMMEWEEEEIAESYMEILK